MVALRSPVLEEVTRGGLGRRRRLLPLFAGFAPAPHLGVRREVDRGRDGTPAPFAALPQPLSEPLCFRETNAQFAISSQASSLSSTLKSRRGPSEAAASQDAAARTERTVWGSRPAAGTLAL